MIPWFNNFGEADAPPAQPPAWFSAGPTQRRSHLSARTSSLQTGSTLSAIGNISLCSLTASARTSANDVGDFAGGPLSSSNSFSAVPHGVVVYPHPPVAVVLARLTSAGAVVAGSGDSQTSLLQDPQQLQMQLQLRQYQLLRKSRSESAVLSLSPRVRPLVSSYSKR